MAGLDISHFLSVYNYEMRSSLKCHDLVEINWGHGVKIKVTRLPVSLAPEMLDPSVIRTEHAPCTDENLHNNQDKRFRTDVQTNGQTNKWTNLNQYTLWFWFAGTWGGSKGIEIFYY